MVRFILTISVLFCHLSNGMSQQVFHAIVAKDGSGNYNTVQAAIDGAPVNNAKPYLIFITNGEYDELVNIPQDKPFIHLVGQDCEKTIIKHAIHCGGKNDQHFELSVNNPVSSNYKHHGVFESRAADFYAENITFLNTYGVNSQSGPQALAIRSHTDRQAFYHCKFRSFQDTWFTSPQDDDRLYVNNCWIEGAVDYFYGGGNALAEYCTFYNVRSGSVITAPCHTPNAKYGYAFRNCIVDGNQQAADGRLKLGRPWHHKSITVWINTTMKIPIAPEGWTDMGTVPGLFAEYNSMDKNGKTIDLSKRKTSYSYTERESGKKITGTCRAVISHEEADRYSYENMILGTDNWNPRLFMQSLPAPSKVKYKKRSHILSWKTVEGAIGYVITDDHDHILDITDQRKSIISFEDNTAHKDVMKGISIRAVNKYGHLGEKYNN